MSKRIVFMGTASFSLKVLQMLLENKYDVVGVVTPVFRSYHYVF